MYCRMLPVQYIYGPAGAIQSTISEGRHQLDKQVLEAEDDRQGHVVSGYTTQLILSC